MKRQTYQPATLDDWTVQFRRRFDEMTRRYGNGPTYSVSEINEFLNNKMQGYEMLFRGRRYGRPPLAKRCEKAIAFLVGIPPAERAGAAKRIDPLLQELKGWFQ